MMKPVQQPGWITGIRLRAVYATLWLATLPVLAAVATQPAHAQTFTTLYSFTGGSDGGEPSGPFAQDAAGNLYGSAGWSNNVTNGTVWRLTPAGKLTVLHTFGGTGDGAFDTSGIIRDAKGDLYGTTAYGGFGDGTIFKLSKTGKETVLYRFTGKPDGMWPTAGLVRDDAGNLYGTTSIGGSHSCGENTGCGTVFKLDPAGKETVLYNFKGQPDGWNPLVARLVRDAKGNFYGVTYYGGLNACTYGCGTVFELSPTSKGKWKETVLYSFAGPGADGQNPYSTLILDTNGNLYGTTEWGGGGMCFGIGCGTVFKLDKTGKETVLYSFTGGSDGAAPSTSLIQDAAGNFYGGTTQGGKTNSTCPQGCGTLFKLDVSGKLTVQHSFNGKDGVGGTFGLRDAAGTFYGYTSHPGGADGWGTVFELTP